jgi:hypothetical protein
VLDIKKKLSVLKLEIVLKSVKNKKNPWLMRPTESHLEE